MPLFRIPPALPAAAMKTYQIAAPLATHWRKATCEEYGCEQYQHGWQTTVDESTELGQRQGEYNRHDRARERAGPPARGGPTRLWFRPGANDFRPPHTH